MALFLDLEEQPQVIKFDSETTFGLSTDKRVRIPNIYGFLSKGFPTMILQDIEYIEEAKALGIRPFAVLSQLLGEAMLEAGSWTSFECLKTVTQAVYSGASYFSTGKSPNTIKYII